MANRFGLPRDIPDPIKRIVRQRDGFGCVYCGSAFYEYEHFDPEFYEATAHSADGIILLCGTCHPRKGTFLSRNAIAAAAANPKCRQKGFSFGAFDTGPDWPIVEMGQSTIEQTPNILTIDDEDILSIRPPAFKGGPFLFSAFLCDDNGTPILEIRDNEWRTPAYNWDVEIVGSSITIRQKSGVISLVLAIKDGVISLERLNFRHRGVSIRITPQGSLEIVGRGGTKIRASAARISKCFSAIVYSRGNLMIGLGGGGSVMAKEIAFGGSRSSENSLGSSKAFEPRLDFLTSRNVPCQCGSGKRYKHCHGSMS